MIWKPVLAAALLAAPIAAARAEPALYVTHAGLSGLTQAQCLERAGPALTASGFRLAEASPTVQMAVQGDFTGSVACITAQPTILVVTIAGPQSDPAVRWARAVREAIQRPASAPAAGTK